MIANKIYRNERGYLELCRDVLEHGVMTPDRTGLGRKKILFPDIVFDVDESFPAATARSAPFRIAFEELMAFLNGELFIKQHLNALGYHIWDTHTSRSFLDSRGLNYLPEGHMGKAYGFQFVAFGGELTRELKPSGGVNQIRTIFKQLQDDPYGSRHVVSIWNPSQSDEMALPPCWYGFQFVVLPGAQGDVLHLTVSSRSSDLPYGMYFNVNQYAYLLCAFAEALDMRVGKLKCRLADAHIYGNQIDYMREIVERDIIETPSQIRFKRNLSSIDDILALTWEDIERVGFDYNRTPVKTPKPILAE